MAEKQNNFPKEVKLTYGQIKEQFLKDLAYAKTKAFSGTAKIRETLCVIVMSAEVTFLQYIAVEEVKTDLGVRTLDLRYAMNQDELLEFCKRMSLRAAGILEKDFSKYVAKKLPHHCVEEPNDNEVIINFSIEIK